MKILHFTLIFSLLGMLNLYGQEKNLSFKTKKFKTDREIILEGDIGYLTVPENRDNPQGRKIKLKFVHLKSLAENPSTPVIYLEGGGGSSTWQIKSPRDLGDWIELLEVSDLIFLDRRGSDDKSLFYVWKEDYPKDFWISEEGANQHYQNMIEPALKTFEKRNIDVAGYNIVEHAKDVDELATALGFQKYVLYGFSFGSHIGMTVMKLFPEKVEKAIFAGADAMNQSFNFPYHLDIHLEKISELVAQDSTLSQKIPDFRQLVNRVMEKLDKQPAIITVTNPRTRKKMKVAIGAFGLALVLRLDIDDYNDIPAIPRLLYSIDQGDYSMLSWFVQKRMVRTLTLPGNGIHQGLASGASEQRWSMIEKQARESIFGNVVNFPFSAAKDFWPTPALPIDTSIPLATDIPTLFISGTLDCRTPVIQVNETMKGFSKAIHIKVENAGHEQAMWDREVSDGAIPAFLLGKDIPSEKAFYGKIEFLPLEGKTTGHPSVQ